MRDQLPENTRPARPNQTDNYDERLVARQNWDRYQYGKDRGHRSYCEEARKLEDFYFGGKGQWSREDLEYLAEQGRPAHTFNLIKPKVNTAIGYEIQNRMDITLKGRGTGTDEELAKTLTKVIMQIADNTQLRWKETEVFGDGLIQKRGYFDVRIGYEDSMLGEIKIRSLDPLDVIPDPDAKGYDPSEWKDVLVTRWMELDEIEAEYGTEARRKIEEEAQNQSDRDFGEDDDDIERNKFGPDYYGDDGLFEDNTARRFRLIERQMWEYAMSDVLISMTGDIRLIEDVSLSEQRQPGWLRSQQRVRRVRWTISTERTVIFDEYSPMPSFTIVPYFPFFRRGRTAGLVEDAVSPQELLNKTMSQFLHIINTNANSGWIYWDDTLSNMSDAVFSQRASENGLTIKLKANVGADKIPQKITANNVPTAFERVMERSSILVGDTLGINEAMSGQVSRDMSGVAAQALQFAAQQGLAVPLDNLGRTRNIMARRLVELVQRFYDQPRVMRIADTDENGKPIDVMTGLNQPQEDGSILNDLTLGEYDVVVTEQPMAITFQNSQFEQVMAMREKGVGIPDEVVLRYSSLADKHEIIDSIGQRQQQPDPLNEAKVKLTEAQTKNTEAQAKKTLAEATNKSVEGMFSAAQTANVIATTPGTAPIADDLLKSAGFVDQNAAPIVPQPGAMPAPEAQPAPGNTDPTKPANPAVGLQAGIKTPENDPMGGEQQ